MDWWVHGICADGTFKQFVYAGGRSNGGGTRNCVVVGGIISGFGRRKVMVVLMRMRMWVKGAMVLMDLILIKTI